LFLPATLRICVCCGLGQSFDLLPVAMSLTCSEWPWASRSQTWTQNYSRWKGGNSVHLLGVVYWKTQFSISFSGYQNIVEHWW